MSNALRRVITVLAVVGISALPAAASEDRPLVVTSARAPRARRDALAEVADVIVSGDERVDLHAALAELGARGLRSVLSEGGPGLFGALAVEDLVDESCVTLSPVLVAGEAPRILRRDRCRKRQENAASQDLVPVHVFPFSDESDAFP